MLSTDNGNNNKFVYGLDNAKAINYTFPIGKLMLPKEYRGYGQTNLNIMREFLSQVNIGPGKYYMDIAPSVQMIFNRQARIAIGYKKQLSTRLLRTAPDGLLCALSIIFLMHYDLAK